MDCCEDCSIKWEGMCKIKLEFGFLGFSLYFCL